MSLHLASSISFSGATVGSIATFSLAIIIVAFICCVSVAIVITGKHRKRQSAFIIDEISNTQQIELDTVKLPSIQTTRTSPTTSFQNPTLSTIPQIQDPCPHYEAVHQLDGDPGSPNNNIENEESTTVSQATLSNVDHQEVVPVLNPTCDTVHNVSQENEYQNIEESYNESETVPSSMIINDP